MKKTNKNVTIETVNNVDTVNRDFSVVFDILNTTPCNKNLLRDNMVKNGFYCTVKTKNTTDYTTLTPNDFYYQFIDGTRVLINAKKTKFQLWSNRTLIESGIFNDLTTDFVSCNDSAYRDMKSSMNIPFTVENIMLLWSKMVENNTFNIIG